MGELSKPKRPLDIKECFALKKSSNIPIYKDSNYIAPNLLDKYVVKIDNMSIANYKNV